MGTRDNLTVLLLEDVLDDYIRTKTLLEDSGMKVLVASAIEEVFNIQDDFDLIIIDLMVDENLIINYVSKVQDYFPNKPIVVVVDSHRSTLSDQLFEMGVKACLIKGHFTPRIFCNIIKCASYNGIKEQTKTSLNLLGQLSLQAKKLATSG